MLLFIKLLAADRAVLNNISIHLMLLFINYDVSSLYPNSNFNTSHVTVYLQPLLQYHRQDPFQYISCYCLSVFPMSEYIRTSHFNTSHVTVYRYGSILWIRFSGISIHLMLLFIVIDSVPSLQPKDISIHLMLLFI